MKKTALIPLILCLWVAVPTACNKSEVLSNDTYITDDTPWQRLSHEKIELGDKLEDPYTVENVTKAIEALYPTKAGRITLKPTDIYARFLPKDDKEFETLMELGVEFMDHPLDYAIIKDGDYYHDPEIEEGDVTWQYAVLPEDFIFPEGIKFEILDYCYISDNDPSTRAGDDGIDWDKVEEKAFELTGNSALYIHGTKASSGPQGRITIVDDEYNGGKPFGLGGVKVLCNSFVKCGGAYTDRDGYYKLSKKFSSKPRYMLTFKNKAGFKIGYNLILSTASTSTLGKGAAEGQDFQIDKTCNHKLFVRSAISAAAYDYIMRCKEDGMDGVAAPPGSLRIWVFWSINASSASMLKHGTLIDNTVVGKYLGIFAELLKWFLPDITIGAKGAETFQDIYKETVHELAHASHFSKVGTKFWDPYAKYVLTSFIFRGREAYGNEGDNNCGYCEIGEMWAYYMQNKLFNERYGGEMPVAGANFWFHPQIFSFLDERGITKGKIFKVLDNDVTDISKLRSKLLSTYPDKSEIINQVFERYGK